MIKVELMKRAFYLAKQGLGYTSPNPMVGAVITDGAGNIAGEGYHRKAGTPHAEVHAINAAGDRARGGILYVNLEPCSHYGRTPPCTKAIIEAGIKTVVISMVDPNPLVAGRGVNQLQNQGINVITGVLEKEARELNKAFIKYITIKRPYVTLKVAMTLDGKIATVFGDSKWITGELSRELVHQLRHQVDAIMVGINTVLVDNPRLTTRVKEGQGKDPIRVVIDSKLRLPLDCHLVTQESMAKTIVFTGSNRDSFKMKELVHRGVIVIETPECINGIDLGWVMDWLGKREISHVLLEGGSQINFSALKADLVDEFWWFIAPKLIGGKTAPTPIGGAGVELMANAYEMDQFLFERIGQDILIKGYPKKGGESCSPD
ncbi:MAG: bifunctional diaminohydroxyphosphoribosylaminopyrimidine deaminase/5-amino-6-(5-phosphoribosylamino)uracil reductase RibD [Clostridia bacterium]|nr:bifunctional diaminohydroxyphosphoribosylaminopyrimidine deaminase/5-amino-6-(5-phosphoribosylamino)uracil reductase RibD [Clostridia bacterium]